MTVIIDNRQDKIYIEDTLSQLMEELVGKALEIEKVQVPVEVSIILVDNQQIRDFNREYRSVDRETDVLSFPMLEYEGYEEDAEVKFDLLEMEGEIDPDTQEILLGDIVISAEKAVQQAEEYGHRLEREIGFLTVHGILHLLGYDHMEPRDEAIMRQKEEEVLQSFQLYRG